MRDAMPSIIFVVPGFNIVIPFWVESPWRAVTPLDLLAQLFQRSHPKSSPTDHDAPAVTLSIERSLNGPVAAPNRIPSTR